MNDTGMKAGKGLSESQFYMWRTLFALAHADSVVSDEEVRFMVEALEDVPFSDEQQAILREDIKTPQKPEVMFAGVTDVRDQAAFFRYARSLVHVDGEYGFEEQAIMLKLQEMHLQNANLDDLLGSVTLELEDEPEPEYTGGPAPRGFKGALHSFRERFMRERFR